MRKQHLSIKSTEYKKEWNERKGLLRSVLQRFWGLRKIYRSNKPNKEEVMTFKETAVQTGKELLEHFEYVTWPNYLHKILGHTQGAILSADGPGSVGILSVDKLYMLFINDLQGWDQKVVDRLRASQWWQHGIATFQSNREVRGTRRAE